MDCSLPGLLSLRFSKQEYWDGLPFPSPGDLPNPGIEPGSLALQADSLPSEPPGKPKHVTYKIEKVESVYEPVKHQTIAEINI